MNIINFTVPNTSNIFAELMMWLVEITSSVALGVILFTLFLKIVTLPFDFMSRFSMRKNSIKMEQMRPELEKLQQQYANDKNLYNQKMMALYKKNGYSMFGACLPTIVTLVIFIIAITGFNSYSRWQNKRYFYDMSVSYNNVLYAGLPVDGEYVIDDNGVLKIDDEKILSVALSDNGSVIDGIVLDGTDLTVKKTETGFSLESANGYIRYSRDITEGKASGAKKFDVVDLTRIINEKYNNSLKNADGDDFAAAKEKNGELTAEDFLSSVGSYMAAETFRNNGAKFLWVKNIWITDSPMSHPVEDSWQEFTKLYEYNKDGLDNDIGQEGYDKLIAALKEEQTAPNGYFILVALTALSSLLTQFIIGKSQKAQMELQTVDGQGAQTQKMMMWMMPIMMAVFAFIYTAAFSLYIVLSSVISLLTTLLINFIADKKFKPKEAGDGEVIRGRVYNPPKKEEPEKPKKKDKTTEDGFLSGLADKKKHPRGRLK